MYSNVIQFYAHIYSFFLRFSSILGSYLGYCSLCYTVVVSAMSLWDPMDHSPPGSSVNGILEARILEWVSISFRGPSQPRDWTMSPALAGGFFTTEPPGKPCATVSYWEKTTEQGKRPVSLKTIRCWWKELEMTQTEGKIYHILG